MFEVVFLVLVPLFYARVTPNGAHIDHAVPELDECATLLWDFEIRNVVQDELDELLVLFLAQPLDEGARGQRYTHAVGCESVLGKAKVKERGYWYRWLAELFLLLHEVATADKADRNFVS